MPIAKDKARVWSVVDQPVKDYIVELAETYGSESIVVARMLKLFIELHGNPFTMSTVHTSMQSQTLDTEAKHV